MRRESFYGRQLKGVGRISFRESQRNYAVFHAMRSANALKEYDSSKHSGVIAYFTKEYLKTEILDRGLAVIIKDSSLCREKSDYDDFYVAGKIEAEEQLKNAKYFVQKIEKYVNLVNE